MRLHFPDLYVGKVLEELECGSQDVPSMEPGLSSLPSGEFLTYPRFSSHTKPPALAYMPAAFST